MPNRPPHDSRQATAERNVEAILDAAQRLLGRGEQPTISAVATEAGVSRPTVYAHFPDRARLLEALVERTVRRSMVAIESAEPESGPALDALQRLIAASWTQLAHNEQIAHASGAELGADAMRRAHETARAVIRELLERGRHERVFRTDLTVEWLVTSCLALIHAAAEEVRAGELDRNAALDALSVTITDAFVTRTS
jgi:AcrR family transcriptional regulator